MRLSTAAAGIAFMLAAMTLTPTPAKAWWARPGVWVAGPTVIYAPPPRVYYAPYPYRHWIPAHFNWRGGFVPAHWGW